MKNKEKFAKEILDIVCEERVLAMNINTKRLCMCTMDCGNCYFSKYNYPHNQGECIKNLVHWVNSEYKEKKVFSEADKALVKGLDKLNWFARDENGDVYGFVIRPSKRENDWVADGDYSRATRYSSATFESLSWEDEEPTHRSEILGEE